MKLILFIVSVLILFFIIYEPIECQAEITSSDYILFKQHIVKTYTISYCNNVHIETIHSHTDENIKNYIKSNPTKKLFKIKNSITNLHLLILTIIILSLFALCNYYTPNNHNIYYRD